MVEEAKKALEKTIQKTYENWVAFLDNYTEGKLVNSTEGELILTDERLMLGNTYEILLSDITQIDLKTRLLDPPLIEITSKQETYHISFTRRTASITANILLGDTAYVHSDISTYTAYWASLLTMAVFHHGNPTTFKLKEPVQPAASIIPDSVRSIPPDYKTTKTNKTVETTSKPLNKLRWITIGFIGAILTGYIAYMILEYLMTL